MDEAIAQLAVKFPHSFETVRFVVGHCKNDMRRAEAMLIVSARRAVSVYALMELEDFSARVSCELSARTIRIKEVIEAAKALCDAMNGEQTDAPQSKNPFLNNQQPWKARGKNQNKR